MAGKQESKQFNFKCWLDNYQWLNDKAVEERCTMTFLLNKLVAEQRKREQ